MIQYIITSLVCLSLPIDRIFVKFTSLHISNINHSNHATFFLIFIAAHNSRVTNKGSKLPTSSPNNFICAGNSSKSSGERPKPRIIYTPPPLIYTNI